MVGVGRGGLGSGEKVGLVGQSQNSAQLICTEYKHPQNNSRQGPRFSIRMVIGIFCSDTETGAATPPGVMQKK